MTKPWLVSVSCSKDGIIFICQHFPALRGEPMWAWNNWSTWNPHHGSHQDQQFRHMVQHPVKDSKTSLRNQSFRFHQLLPVVTRCYEMLLFQLSAWQFVQCARSATGAPAGSCRCGPTCHGVHGAHDIQWTSRCWSKQRPHFGLPPSVVPALVHFWWSQWAQLYSPRQHGQPNQISPKIKISKFLRISPKI